MAIDLNRYRAKTTLKLSPESEIEISEGDLIEPIEKYNFDLKPI